MKSAYIALGYKCNHNCIMCPLSASDRKLSEVSYDSVIDSVKKEGLSFGDHVTLSGGEPTLCDYLYDLVEHFSLRGIRVTLLTNCSGFADRNNALLLAKKTDPSIFNVVTAIHSADADIHDRITGTPGSFNKSIEGLKNLHEAGVNITIKSIITALNYKGLPGFAEMIIKRFPPDVEIQFTSADYSGNAAKNREMLAVTFSQSQSYLETALEMLTQKCLIPYRISVIEMPLCSCSPVYWRYFRNLGSNVDSYIAPNSGSDSGVIHKLPNGCNTCYKECSVCDVACFCPGAWNTAYELMGAELLRPLHYKV